MFDQMYVFIEALINETGLQEIWWGNFVMIGVGATMIYFALVKHYEPASLASSPMFPDQI